MSTGKRKQSQRLIEPVALRYVGHGDALVDVPARDLSAEESAAYDVAQLLGSGLYEPAHEAPTAPRREEEPDGTGA